MSIESHDLNGKTIVIVGASSGFGRGAALQLAAMGANVVLAARRVQLLDAMVHEIADRGGAALAVETDVSNAAHIDRLSEAAVAKFGNVDIWINNVGVGALGFFWDIPVEDHARLIDVNLKGLIYGAHAALKLFRSQGYGVLINTGSIDSEVPLAYQATYAASKAAVLSLSRTLSEELRLSGQETIQIATIMPWAIDTPWWTHAANYTGHQPRMAAMDDPSIVVDTIVRACTDPHLEMPVGPKAHASNLSHHLFPNFTERLSADIADKEVKKAWEMPPTTGSLHQPMAEGTDVGGGIRERMKLEDSE